METHELQQLLSEMSLQEKIGQMVQLTGAYFDKEAVLTGVLGTNESVKTQILDYNLLVQKALVELDDAEMLYDVERSGKDSPS